MQTSTIRNIIETEIELSEDNKKAMILFNLDNKRYSATYKDKDIMIRTNSYVDESDAIEELEDSLHFLKHSCTQD